MFETHVVGRRRYAVRRLSKKHGIPRGTMYRRMRELGLTPEEAVAVGKRAPYQRGRQHCSLCVAAGRDGTGHDRRTCADAPLVGLRAVARETGIPLRTLQGRCDRGMSLDEAIAAGTTRAQRPYRCSGCGRTDHNVQRCPVAKALGKEDVSCANS